MSSGTQEMKQLASDVAFLTCMTLVEGTDFKDYKYE